MSDTPTPTWHVDADVLRLWVDGRAGAVASASVEQHLVRCAGCRALVSHAFVAEMPASVPDLERVWAAVRDDIELPRPSRAQRALIRLGLDDSDALLLTSAPAMRAAWVNAVALVLAFVLLAGTYGDTRSVVLFLVGAPLIPMIGVALAYGADAEVAFEQEVATAFSPVRLVLLRTAAVLVTTIPIVLLGGLVNPDSLAIAWLVPALGFTAVLLAASTWFDPAPVAIVLAVAWTFVVLSTAAQGMVSAVYDPTALVAYATVGGIATVVLVHRLRRTGTLGGLL